MWSGVIEGGFLGKDDSSQDEIDNTDPPEEGGKEAEEGPIEESKKSTPDIRFDIQSERKIANARLCDVLRKLFGANG